MNELLEIIESINIDFVVISISILIITTFVKKPIKNLIKLKKFVNLKKYLTILPIILGFFITKIYITYIRFIDLNLLCLCDVINLHYYKNMMLELHGKHNRI